MGAKLWGREGGEFSHVASDGCSFGGDDEDVFGVWGVGDMVLDEF